MKRFWLFRTNLTNLESYHKYDNLEDFENNLWDFYLLQGLWLLKNIDCKEVTIWRMTKKKNYDITFTINGKKFIQKFVRDFNVCFKENNPSVSFFRGGFPEYCRLLRKNRDFFGTSLYLGASKRRYPIYGGKYNNILVESERDMRNNYIPFYKIGPPLIFHPLDLEKKWDICWPCNFSQIKQKGQEYFIHLISKSKFLKTLNIVHIGNQPKVGKNLCTKYKVNNIEFLDRLDRFGVNEVLNQSKFGVVTSNEVDGCPRISTEILASGTPLLIRKQTRLLKYYRSLDYVKTFTDSAFERVYKEADSKYEELRQKNLEGLKNELSLDTIMNMNVKLWR